MDNRSNLPLTLFGVLGAWSGLLAGVYEAAWLFWKPRVPMLLKPDTNLVVWFLVPLVDSALFAGLGVMLGTLCLVRRLQTPSRMAAAAGVGAGVLTTFLVYCTFLAQFPLAQHWSGTGRLALLSLSFALVVLTTCLLLRGSGLSERVPAVHSRSFRVVTAAINGLAVAGVLLGAGLALCRIPRPYFLRSQPKSIPAMRNIILISLDTVRADHLHCYGYGRATTPNFDQLAGQGVLFENAVSPSSWTLASHASILTGLLPHQHGATFGVPLRPGIPMLSEILRAHGYDTAGFSANYDYGLQGWGIARGFELYNDDSSSLRHNFFLTVAGREFRNLFCPPVVGFDRFGRRDARELNGQISRWLKNRANEPFFLFINYFDAHDPYLAPPPYDRRFGTPPHDLLRRISPVIHQKPLAPPLSEQEQSALIAGYDNCLAFLDSQVGALIDLLRQSADWPHTVVIITADHGESFGEHEGYYGHGWSLYRELLHVPLIIMGSGIQHGIRVQQAVSTRDLFTTALDLTGVRGPEPSHGVMRFITGDTETQRPEEPIVSELSAVPGTQIGPAISLTMSNWHYISPASGSVRAYHYRLDPTEQENLSQVPRYAPVARTLHKQLCDDLGRSRRPWFEAEYAAALDRLGCSFWAARSQRSPTPRPDTEQQELLGTLPYR